MTMRCVLEVVVEVGGRSQALDGDDPGGCEPSLCDLSSPRVGRVEVGEREPVRAAFDIALRGVDLIG
jgi:hypothetical protein